MNAGNDNKFRRFLRLLTVPLPELPDLGQLRSAAEIQTLHDEMRRSRVMRAEVAVAAALQVLDRLPTPDGQIPAAEVRRVLMTIADAL